VATTWDNAYLDALHELDSREHSIGELFGAGASSFLGQGRPSMALPQVSSAQQKEHIARAHAYGFEFTYTVNAPCMGNAEYTQQGQKQILQFFDELCEMGVDCVVMANPYLIEIVKRKFSSLKVKVSVISQVNSIQGLQYYADMGADAVTLDFSSNRDFRFLKKAVALGRVELELLATEYCLYKCPFRAYHYNILGHASQPPDKAGGVYIEYPCIRCTLLKFTHPVELIRSRWIRPEDMQVYEAIGIHRFKVGYRTGGMAWNLAVARAYLERRYEGNWLELLFPPSGQLPFGLDNRKLDGFLDFFQKQTCYLNCDDCTYCQKVADETLTVIRPEALAETVTQYQQLCERLLTCSLFGH
jgi:collagenase-like PrtC family protease